MEVKCFTILCAKQQIAQTITNIEGGGREREKKSRQECKNLQHYCFFMKKIKNGKKKKKGGEREKEKKDVQLCTSASASDHPTSHG